MQVVGMKRPYPFSLDYPLAPAFNYKLSSFADRSTNSKTLSESEIGYHFDAPNPTSRLFQFNLLLLLFVVAIVTSVAPALQVEDVSSVDTCHRH